jgi:TM2 domain-containing membrane protein YozV
MKKKVFQALICIVVVFQAADAQRKNDFGIVQKDEDRNAAPSMFTMGADQPQKKSGFLAVALSLILPGMGELYAGNFSTGKYHLIAEGGIWLAYASLRLHSTWERQDAHSLAVARAGVNFDGKNSQYDVDIGNFLTMQNFNNAQLRNRTYDLMYFGSSYNWNWDSDADRQTFKNLRIQSDADFNNSKFVIAAAVVNRLISAFRVGRFVSKQNSILSENWNFQIIPYADNMMNSGLSLHIEKSL